MNDAQTRRGETVQIIETTNKLTMQTKRNAKVVYNVNKKVKPSFNSLTKQLTSSPTIDETVIELMTAIKLSKLTPLQLNILILVSCGNGVTVSDLDNMKVIAHSVHILRALNDLTNNGLIHRDEKLIYYANTTGNYLLRSILPSFTFPLPRF